MTDAADTATKLRELEASLDKLLATERARPEDRDRWTRTRETIRGAIAQAEDAARWRALMASQRIRVMGSAGFLFAGDEIAVRDGGYMHLGVELWNVHAAPHPSAEFPQDRCRALLTFYVDRIREGLGTVEAPR